MIIGQGSFGIVQSFSNDVVVKYDKSKFVNSLEDEINFYTRIGQSEFIPKFYGADKLKRYFYMERFEMDLDNWLMTKYDYNTLNIFVVQIISALEFLHKHGFVHNDVKGRNIFISCRKAVVGDFGETRFGTNFLDDLIALGKYMIEWFSRKTLSYSFVYKLNKLIKQKSIKEFPYIGLYFQKIWQIPLLYNEIKCLFQNGRTCSANFSKFD